MLGGRRIIEGPCTPVPRWKLYENPFYDGIAAAAAAAAAQQQQQHHHHNNTKGGGRGIAVSARKLAATLWELQEFPFSVAAAAAAGKSPSCPCIQHRSSSSSTSAATKKARSQLIAVAESNNRNGSHGSPLHSHPAIFHSQQATLAKESMIQIQHPNKAWENVKKSCQSQSTSSRQNAALRSHVHRLFKERADARLNQLAQPKPGSYTVLHQIRDMQDHRTASAQSSVVAALHIELERVRARAHELELAHKSARREIDNLLKKVSEEKLILRNREQEKIRSAVQAVKTEAEEEKKARRRIESVNRKMSRELVDANITIAKAVQELEKERKARELMEDVCNELAREIGEDKHEVEELKRESAKVREEIEEERKMLQMAEVWREERVQMKLAEARLDIEEKNMILDNLRAELEAFLNTRKALLYNAEDDEVTNRTVVQEAEGLMAAIDALQIGDVELPNSCRSPGTNDGALSLLRGGEMPNNHNDDNRSPQPDKRESWSWSSPATRDSREPDSRLATKDEVLDRLRRKWEQNVQRFKGRQEGDGGRKWEDERGDASEWNSQSENQGDDAKEEDGSQWESASDEDILEAVQQANNSHESSQGDRLGGGPQSEPQADAAPHSNPFDKILSPQAFTAKPAAEVSSGDDFCRASTPSTGSGKVSTEGRRSSGEGLRSSEERRSSGEGLRSSEERRSSGEGLRSSEERRSSGEGLRSSDYRRSSGEGLRYSEERRSSGEGLRYSEERRSSGEGLRSSGEGSRSLQARGMSEVSRSAHMRLVTEQGTPSPSRDWRSPDRGNPHIAMGIKGFIEWPKMYRENGVKGKVYESKVEKVDRQMLKQSS